MRDQASRGHDLVDIICQGSGSVAVLAAIGSLRAWCDAAELDAAASVNQSEAFPERVIADATRSTLREAICTVERLKTRDSLPSLGAAASDGAISGAHVDVATRALKRCSAVERAALVARDGWLAAVASRASVEHFEKVVADETKRLQRSSAADRFERQRRDTRLTTWTDNVTGMFHLRGRFDPKSALVIAAQLERRRNALFAESAPESCPDDPTEKHHHLQALALVDVMQGASSGAAGGSAPRVDVVAVLDHDADGMPFAEFDLPVDLPIDHLREMIRRDAVIHPVIVRNGVVIGGSGRLNLGREVRLANAAQRRALRVMYRTCAVPGCTVPIKHCQPHHIVWWERGGLTNLDNLLPLCSKHHHSVHEGGWQLQLGPSRELTITCPSGQVMTTGPPNMARQ